MINLIQYGDHAWLDLISGVRKHFHVISVSISDRKIHTLDYFFTCWHWFALGRDRWMCLWKINSILFGYRLWQSIWAL